jgi:pimeloyl-ACP methyl ester carboxylesterase
MRALLAVGGILWVSAALAAEPPPEAVTFPIADGGTVSADRFGAADAPGVVLAHGAVFDKGSWATFARTLPPHGLQALAIDFRGYGASRAPVARDLFQDVLGAVRWLRTHGAPRVAVVGASMGATAAARAAAESPPGTIARLVLLSPADIPEAERVPGPTLVVASDAEPAITRIRAAFARLRDPKELVVLPGTAHAQHIFATDQRERLAQLVVEFVGRP